LGANVILFGRRLDALQETATACNAAVAHHIEVVAMEDFDALAIAATQSVAQLGKVDGIIHCAGISTTLPLRVIRPEKLQQYLNVNVVGAIELSRILCKPTHFSKAGGSIIFISSVMGQVGQKGKTIYSITKGALEAGTRSLALELAKKQIRVNCVAPGVIETPMSANAVYSQEEASLEAVVAMHPLGLGQVTDIANSCIFLLSDAARWITGTTLVVDGGYLAH
jgi:NAD(P)-dependent dehydrogenase (short-subunit alcohol dehydrogenase family)